MEQSLISELTGIFCDFLIALATENLCDETVKAKIRNGFVEFDRVSKEIKTISFSDENLGFQYEKMVKTYSESRQSFETNELLQSDLSLKLLQNELSLKSFSHEQVKLLVEKLELIYLDLFMMFGFKDLRDPSVEERIKDSIFKFEELVFEIDGYEFCDKGLCLRYKKTKTTVEKLMNAYNLDRNKEDLLKVIESVEVSFTRSLAF
jgi:hypothetical protein